MREILFRGRRKDTDEWVYGNLICSKNYAIGSQQFPLERPTVVDPETVGQYTGLKDINGNRIFEGDILAHEDKSVKFGVVEFDEEYAIFDMEVGGIPFVFSDIDTEEYEIIGNIYDNPELIGGKNA